MKNMFGDELNVGDVISYTVRSSSTMGVRVAKILTVSANSVSVLAVKRGWQDTVWGLHSYTARLTSCDTIVHVDINRLPDPVRKALWPLDEETALSEMLLLVRR